MSGSSLPCQAYFFSCFDQNRNIKRQINNMLYTILKSFACDNVLAIKILVQSPIFYLCTYARTVISRTLIQLQYNFTHTEIKI